MKANIKDCQQEAQAIFKQAQKKRRAVDWREPPGAGVVDGK